MGLKDEIRKAFNYKDNLSDAVIVFSSKADLEDFEYQILDSHNFSYKIIDNEIAELKNYFVIVHKLKKTRDIHWMKGYLLSYGGRLF